MMGHISDAPVFKLDFRSSAPFAGVSDLNASGACAHRRLPRSVGVAVAAAVGGPSGGGGDLGGPQHRLRPGPSDRGAGQGGRPQGHRVRGDLPELDIFNDGAFDLLKEPDTRTARLGACSPHFAT